jgi:hypothetical protein
LIDAYAVDLLPAEMVRPLLEMPSIPASPFMPSIRTVPVEADGP